MKKILISDYDDTFYCNDESIKANIEEVQKFRKKGNIFAIATARTPQSIKEKIEKYDIKCDYIISYIGGVIEKGNEVFHVNYIDKKNIDIIEKNLSKYKNIDIYRNGLKENPSLNEIIGYSIDTKGDLSIINAIKNEFANNKDVFLRTFDNVILYINNSYNSKIKAIKYLTEQLKIEKKEIYTIGDYDDDLEMLLEFNGYRMENSSENVVNKINNKVSSVEELLKKIME